MRPKQFYWLLPALLLVLVVGRGLVGSPRPMTVQEVWDRIRGVETGRR